MVRGNPRESRRTTDEDSQLQAVNQEDWRMNLQVNDQGWATDDGFPIYLKSYQSLEQHFRAQFQGLSTTAKGDRFAHFTKKLIPQTEIGLDFDSPVLNEKKSGDEGIDLTAQGKDGNSVLYVQTKLWVDRADDIDSIPSKFQAYLHQSNSPIQKRMFDSNDTLPRPHFLLVTLSSLKGIRQQYEKREFASKNFYRQCIEERRLHFVDGPQIWSILRAAYTKISETPANLILNFEIPTSKKDNVFFGVISSNELRSLYKQFGDALFFENIRDFIGPAKGRERVGRTTPNDEIIKTITTCPGKMLERNNGIVFRARHVDQGDSPNQLILGRGSIVNGCQTTMCLVEYAEQSCLF
jgi:hypothetical protein